MAGRKGKREREREGWKDTWEEEKERKAESWPDSKPVERHALGKEKQTKKGMDSEAGKSSLRFEAGADRPTGRPSIYSYINIYIYMSQASSCLLHPNTSAFRQVLSFPCRCYILSSPDKQIAYPRFISSSTTSLLFFFPLNCFTRTITRFDQCISLS